jgi:hypothetical protein
LTNPFDKGAPAPTQAPAPAPSAASDGFGGVDTKQSSDPYSVSLPTSASGVRMSDPGILDQLLLVEPVEYIPSMMTSASREPTDVLRVNILPLTGELEGKLQEDVLIFQEALKRELKKTLQGPNRWLLAFHHLGAAKPGQSAPYIFTPPNEDQVKIFEKFKAQRAAS